jgi:hypothetical protein
MNGLPGDRHADARANVRFAARLARMGVDAAGAALFAPYPGSAIFDELLERGEITMGEDLIFFPVARNDFSRPLIRSQRLNVAWVKFYQLATLAAFVGSKFLFHPWIATGSLGRALFRRPEKRYFDKTLRSLLTAVARLVVSPCNGEPVTWPAIDYQKFSIDDLLRKRRMAIPTLRRSQPANRAHDEAAILETTAS